MTPTFLKRYSQSLVEFPSVWICRACSLIRFRSCIFDRTVTGVGCPSHEGPGLLICVITGDVNFDHLMKVSVRWPHCELIFPLLINVWQVATGGCSQYITNFSSYFLPINLTFIHSLPRKMTPVVIFSFHPSLFIDELEAFPSLLVTHLFVHVRMDCNLLVLFCCLNCPKFGKWEPFQAGSCVLLITFPTSSTSYAFWQQKMTQVHLVLSEPFFKGILFLLTEELVFGGQDLGTGCACVCWYNVFLDW